MRRISNHLKAVRCTATIYDDSSRRRLVLTFLWLWLACLAQAGAAQFVEITAEIEINDWSDWFQNDKENVTSGRGDSAESIFTKPITVRCVVGTNRWMMEGDFRSNARVTRWFTGSNIIERTEITAELSDATKKKLSQSSRLAFTDPRVGEKHIRVDEPVDGNPGRPVRVEDRMETHGKICWLAFCSGAVLKGKERRIPLPSDLWKQYLPASAKFSNEVTLFEDDLSLPRTIEVFTEKDQVLLQYQVRYSTNVLGWNFPLEFYVVQYNPAFWPRTNSWEVHLTAKGRLTNINAGSEPQIPATEGQSHAER